MSDAELDKYRAPALDKGLDILELLAGTAEGLSQAEIAKALNRTPNEIYRMLDRLVRRAYVRRSSVDRYELTLKLFELAHASPPIRRLVRQADPVLHRFAHDAEQAVHLVICDRNVLVVVAQVDSPGYWNVAVRVGSRIGFNTGSGRVFLAFATDEECALMLEDEPELVPADLGATLKRIRRQQFETMNSLQVSNVTNLSIPIFGPLGSVVAVLTSPYVRRLDKAEAPGQTAALKLLIEAGQKISARSVVGD
ncbi:MAG: IclR family transcriptional regulator [Devosia sp.]